MKEFINNIIPNLKNASEKLNAEAILKNQQWVLVNEDGITTTTYIFRNNNELLIVVNGDVTSGTWEYITKDKLLIKIGDQMLMYRNQFVDDKLLALKKDGALGFNVFLNEKVIDEFVSNTLKIESHLKSFYEIDSLNTNKFDSRSYNENRKINDNKVVFSDLAPAIIFCIIVIIGLFIYFKTKGQNDFSYQSSYGIEENLPIAEDVYTEEALPVSEENPYYHDTARGVPVEEYYYEEAEPVAEEVATDEYDYSY